MKGEARAPLVARSEKGDYPHPHPIATGEGRSPPPLPCNSLCTSGRGERGGYAQASSVPVHRRGFIPDVSSARWRRVASQRSAQTRQSWTSCDGSCRLRATNAGNHGRPVGCPTGWYLRSNDHRTPSLLLLSDECMVWRCITMMLPRVIGTGIPPAPRISSGMRRSNPCPGRDGQCNSIPRW